MDTRTSIDDLLDLNDFNPQNEKEEYMGFHENVEKYAAQSNENEMKHGYPENTPPPDMYLKTLEKSRHFPPTGIRQSMTIDDHKADVRENYNGPNSEQSYMYHDMNPNNPFNNNNHMNNDFNVDHDQSGNHHGPPHGPPHDHHHGPPHDHHHGPPHNTMHNKESYATPIMYEMPMNHHNHSCMNISDHIQNCRICSRYYDTDKTIYLVVIVILLVIIALLIRKILNL